jgi:hypothetical protein
MLDESVVLFPQVFKEWMVNIASIGLGINTLRK